MGFGAVQTLVGVTKLSELGVDVSKNWLAYLIKNLGDPVAAQDAATAAYVLAEVDAEATTRAEDDATEATARAAADLLRLLLAGGTMSGDIAMGTKLVTGLGAPVADNDAARKKYIDDLVASYSKVIWKDASEQALYFEDQIGNIAWTDLDLTAFTSANAKFAILVLWVGITSFPGDWGEIALQVRKNGTTPDSYPEVREIRKSTLLYAAYNNALVIIGLDTYQAIEYRFNWYTGGPTAVGWGQIDVLGYIE